MRALSCHRLACGVVLAAIISGPVAAQTDAVAPSYLTRSPTSGQSTQSRETKEQDVARQRAQQWDLSVSDWKRYQTLLKGIDGYRSDKLDPLTLLGIRARSREEQRRYARKLARLEHDRAQRILSFQKTYDQVFSQLYANETPVNPDTMTHALMSGQESAHKLGLDNGTRKAVFVKLRDCSACNSKIKQLASAHTAMDIFILGANSDDAIRSWATQIGLDPQRVRSGDITLNHAPTAVAQSLAGQSLPRVSSR